MNYAEAFKALRLAYKLTQTEFAELLQVSKPTIQKLEAGDYPPSEKMSARLADVFRSKKFRDEFRPRVDAGDLHCVRTAFGDLLDLVDAEGAASSSFDSTKTINLSVAYADLKQNYTDFQAIVRSQQDTIRDLSVSAKNHSESTKIIAESNRTLAESNKYLSVSVKRFSESSAVKKR